MKTHLLFRALTLLSVWMTVGCINTYIRGGGFRVSAPVLVGPVLRINGSPQDADTMEKGVEVEGMIEERAAAGGGTSYVQQHGTVYQVTNVATSSTKEGNLDEVMRTAAYRASRKPGGIVAIYQLCAKTWFHHYVYYASAGNKLSAHGWIQYPKGDSQ